MSLSGGKKRRTQVELAANGVNQLERWTRGNSLGTAIGRLRAVRSHCLRGEVKFDFPQLPARSSSELVENDPQMIPF